MGLHVSLEVASGKDGGPVAGTRRTVAVTRYLLLASALGAGYVALAAAGSVVQFPGEVQAVWWPLGWAVGFLYLAGLRYWPGAVVADLVLGLVVNDPTLSAYLQTAGNAVEVLIAAVLARRLLGPGTQLSRPDEVVRMLLAIAVGTAFSATVGVTALGVTGGLTAAALPVAWRTWWLGDTSGGLVVMPLAIIWRSLPLVRNGSGRRAVEAVAIGLAVVGASLIGFSSSHPLTYIVFPVLIGAALRSGVPGATAAVALAAVSAVAMTANHRGPFAVSSIDDTVLSVQLYVLVAAITTLFLGAVVTARRRTAVQLAQAQRREAEQAGLARQEIARDLHDSVSQTLFSLTLQAAAAEHLLVADRPSAAVEPVREVSRLAHGALAELRALIFELRSEAIAEEGLVAALAKQAAALSVQRDIAITVDGPAERLPLTTDTEEHLYRLGQEAMGNAAKHSGGDAIELTVRCSDGAVRLEVRDHGRGFDAGLDYAGHLGLRTMRSRATEIGGTLRIDSELGSGTTITVTVPAAAGGRSDGEGRGR